MTTAITESIVEEAALAWFEGVGIYDPTGPGYRTGYSQRRTHLLWRCPAGRPAAIGAGPDQPHEGRLAKIALLEEERPHIDPGFEEVTEGEEQERKEHFERRLEAIEGKGMIVCMSRRIAVDLYNAITRLRPEWHDVGDDKGAIKVVMTGSASDPLDWQPHIRNKPRREGLAKGFKDPNDPLKLVIVRTSGTSCSDHQPSLLMLYPHSSFARDAASLRVLCVLLRIQEEDGRPLAHGACLMDLMTDAVLRWHPHIRVDFPYVAAHAGSNPAGVSISDGVPTFTPGATERSHLTI